MSSAGGNAALQDADLTKSRALRITPTHTLSPNHPRRLRLPTGRTAATLQPELILCSSVGFPSVSAPGKWLRWFVKSTSYGRVVVATGHGGVSPSPFDVTPRPVGECRTLPLFA